MFQKLGSVLAHEFAHAHVALIGVDAVALLSTNDGFCIGRKEPFSTPVHMTATALAGVVFDMLYARILRDTALHRDPEKVLAEARVFARANSDGSTKDDASKIMRTTDEQVILALPLALNAAVRALHDYDSAKDAHDLIALTVSAVIPEEKCVLITRPFLSALSNRRKGMLETVVHSDWNDDLPDDLLALRKQQINEDKKRTAAEMVRRGELDANGRLTAKGAQRLNLSENYR